MTRRQALRKTIAYLHARTDLPAEMEQAVRLLEELLAGLPGKIWDDASIRKAVENYISEHNYPPCVKDLGRDPALPSHTVIANCYKMTAGRWLDANYPKSAYGGQPGPYAHHRVYPSVEVLVDAFVAEYRRLSPASSAAFNKERDKRIPTWQYVARECGVKTWRELRAFCGLPVNNPRKGEIQLTISKHKAKTEKPTPIVVPRAKPVEHKVKQNWPSAAEHAMRKSKEQERSLRVHRRMPIG